MASNPTVNVAILGDAADLKRAMKETSDSAETMGRNVDKAGTDASGGIGRMTEAADGSERRFRGMNDTIGGTQSLMDGLSSGNIVGVIQGLTDLAGGIADFVGPALQKMGEKLGLVTVATEAQTVAQEESNVAMSLNPIGLVVIALVALAAAFYVAWTKSETFREIVTGAFDAVRNAAETAFNWVRDHWELILTILTGPFGLAVAEIVKHRDEIIGFLEKVPDKIKAAFYHVEDVVTAPFKAARDAIDGIADGVGHAFDAVPATLKGIVNGLIDAINKLQIHLHIDIPFAPDVNFDWDGLHIPHLAAGGVVRARPGGTLLVAGEAGVDEAVVPLDGRGFGGNVYNYWPAGVNPANVVSAQRRWTSRNGG